MDTFCNNTPFWDTDLLWYNSWPQFTPCFQATALTWIPSVWLWLVSPLYIYYLTTVSPTNLKSFWTFYLKLGISSFLVLLSCVQVVDETTMVGASMFKAIYVAAIVRIVTFILVVVLVCLERRKGVVTSGVLFMFWLFLAVVDIVPFYTFIKQQEQEHNLLRFAIFYIEYGLTLCGLVLSCIAEQLPDPPPNTHPCMELSASFLSRRTFWWTWGLLSTGYRKTLTETDVRDLHPRDATMTPSNAPRFLRHWKTRLREKKERANETHDEEADERTPLIVKDMASSESSTTRTLGAGALLSALWKTYWTTILSASLWKTLYDIINLLTPLLLGELISFTEDKTAPEWKGFTLAAAMFCSIIVQSMAFQATWHQFTGLAIRARAVLIAAIYRKSLKLNNNARREATVGEIVNLMSVDSDNVKRWIMVLWGLWSIPLQAVLCLLLLYNTVGLSMLAGLAVLVVVVPFNYVLFTTWQRIQRAMMKLKDERMKIASAVLNGIKILKLYAWEPPFLEKIQDVRFREVKDILKISIVQAFVVFTWTMTPYLISLATLLTYIYTAPDHYLSPQIAFVAVSLFNILRAVVIGLPDQLSWTVQANVSLKRIAKFLTSEELGENNVQFNPNQGPAVCIKNGSFLWNKRIGQTLRNITISVDAGELVAVVGPVGAGKSSLLSAMFGEMEKLNGDVGIKGSLAYVPQEAWIQNDTLRNNVLFGNSFDQENYDRVIECCALKPDLDIFTAGDLTEIGEKGINLSGGQKQRVSLARAVYNDADVYLLDDPLSAVDSHVGKHIFDSVVSNEGILGRKTRILVTHGIHWLPRVDSIIVVNDGEISERGTYEELLEHDGPFAQFLQTYLLSSMDTEKDDPEEEEIKRQVLQRLESVKSDSSEAESLKHDAGTVVAPSRPLTRLLSESKETNSKLPPTNDKLIKEEKVEEGKVSWNIYGVYCKLFGIPFLLLCAAVYLVYQTSSVAASVWLSRWTDDPELNNLTSLPSNSSGRLLKNNFYLALYGGLGASQAVCILAFSLLLGYRVVNTSRELHNKMLANIMHAPMSFFDTTPTGRIVNRLSQDMNIIDVQLPQTLKLGTYSVFELISSIVVVSYSTPIFLAVVVPLAIVYYFVQVFYINTARQLKRLESKTRSPIYSHFGETISGSSVIRAFRAQARFIKDSELKVDENQRFAFYGFCVQRWLGFNLQLLASIITAAATIFAVLLRDSLSGGIVGLSITYALQMTKNLNWVVRMTAEMESQIVSVERVQEYTHLETEAPWSRDSNRPNPSWPLSGLVKFKDFSTRYRPGLDMVLKGISFSLNPGEKVGVVGRTGAGKSSLTLSLFRLIEAVGGEIDIDGVDISTLGLHDLRRKLTILPQDPVLFSGSLRSNVDPFSEYTDPEIWTCLEHAHLKTFVESLPGTLEHECSEGGENMSVGQRQLLCLARALLRKTKILILDEATAAVDMETDDLIQQTIRSEFRDCTVLTIAHRINTIMDYDRILVLDNGKVAEFDTPSILLGKQESMFYSLAKTAGLVT